MSTPCVIIMTQISKNRSVGGLKDHESNIIASSQSVETKSDMTFHSYSPDRLKKTFRESILFAINNSQVRLSRIGRYFVGKNKIQWSTE